MRRLVLLCALVLLVGCAKEPVPPPAPLAPPPPPAPDPFFVYRVEHDGETLGDIARWYTGKYGNWQILTKPVNPDLTQCCAKLEVGREVKIPRHLIVRTDPMPAPKKRVTSGSTGRSKTAKSKSPPPTALEEGPASSEDSGSGSEESLPAAEPAEAPPPIIGPK
jgi:hypothetical protein